MDKLLHKIYFLPESPGALGGIDRLYNEARKKYPKIRKQDIQAWMKSQETYALHKPVRYKFRRNSTIVRSIDQQWQMDLVSITSLKQFNDGYGYILTVIDVLSRYAWAKPLLTKSGQQVINQTREIFQQGRQPQVIQTDKGTEFFNAPFVKFLTDQNIHLFSTDSETKASLVQ